MKRNEWPKHTRSPYNSLQVTSRQLYDEIKAHFRVVLAPKLTRYFNNVTSLYSFAQAVQRSSILHNDLCMCLHTMSSYVWAGESQQPQLDPSEHIHISSEAHSHETSAVEEFIALQVKNKAAAFYAHHGSLEIRNGKPFLAEMLVGGVKPLAPTACDNQVATRLELETNQDEISAIVHMLDGIILSDYGVLTGPLRSLD